MAAQSTLATLEAPPGTRLPQSTIAARALGFPTCPATIRTTRISMLSAGREEAVSRTSGRFPGTGSAWLLELTKLARLLANLWVAAEAQRFSGKTVGSA